MAWLVRALLLACLLTASACSMETAINKLSSAEDRAFARQFVEDVRRGNSERLETQFDQELWASGGKQLLSARSHLPKGPGETKLVGYQRVSNLTNGVGETRKEYTLVTTDGERWAVVRIATLAKENGPARIVGWRIDGFSKPPPELDAFEAMNRIAPWLQGFGLILLLGVIGLVWWLISRSRRRADPGADL